LLNFKPFSSYGPSKSPFCTGVCTPGSVSRHKSKNVKPWTGIKFCALSSGENRMSLSITILSKQPVAYR